MRTEQRRHKANRQHDLDQTIAEYKNVAMCAVLQV